MNIKRNILLNPGPATTTHTVKAAQIVPDICPRETEFGELMRSVAKDLTSLVADTDHYTTVLFGGSGTAAVEAVISSVVPHERQILIVNNGAYGERMCRIAESYGMNFLEFKSSAVEPIPLEELEQQIRSRDNISHIAVVHNETTTGLLNRLEPLGKIAKKYRLELIVDAMSSYAAVPINMQQQDIHYLVASSNKNIQGMAGVGFVISDNRALESTREIKPRNFYLNLYAQFDSFRKTGQMRFTPPVQTIYALKQAIVECLEEGVENRYARYSRSWHVLIEGLENLGLRHLVDKAHHSRIITSIEEPELDGFDFDELHDFCYEKGYTIYPGKTAKFNTFRIANIGDIDHTDIAAFLSILRDYLHGKKN